MCVPPQMLSQSSPWLLLAPERGSCRPEGPPRHIPRCISSMQWLHLPLKAFGVRLRACRRQSGILVEARFSQTKRSSQLLCFYSYTPPRLCPFVCKALK